MTLRLGSSGCSVNMRIGENFSASSMVNTSMSKLFASVRPSESATVRVTFECPVIVGVP